MMPKKFDIGTLFEPLRADSRVVAYPTFAKELAALSAGKKGISRESVTVEGLGDKGTRAFLRRIAEHELAVVLYPHEPIRGWPWERQEYELYYGRLDQLWRIQALHALKETAFVDGRWGWAAENQQSHLLGYSAAMRKRWLAALRHARPETSAVTVYSLLDATRAARVRSLGHRSLGTAQEVEGLQLSFIRSSNKDDLKKDALRRIPNGLTLARVAIGWGLARPWISLPVSKAGTSTVKVTGVVARALNKHLASKVQLLTARGWRD